MNHIFTKTLTIFFLAAGLFTTNGAQAQVPTISTVAGNLGRGYSGDGQLATAAEINLPQGVAVDDSGNMYIADTWNNRIRKVSISTGIITTYAGNGVAGYSGFGVAANSAELDHPIGITVDDTGNVYFTDNTNQVIREVRKSTGIITTIAGNGSTGFSGDGGLATSDSVEFSSPFGIKVDDTGNIYIADEVNSRIRKITKSTGIITTIAGNGVNGFGGDGKHADSAEFFFPTDVAIDTAGNIYIADGVINNRVRKITASTGIISTVAGNGGTGSSGNGGPATAAELELPAYLALDDSGNVYISDLGGAEVRKLTVSSGIISDLAGDSLYGFSGDGGPADSAEFSEPSGLALDVCGNVYIIDRGNNDLRKVTITGPSPTTVIKLPATSCPEKLLAFNDSSNFNATNWTWRVTGGIPDTSTKQNPFIAFNTADIYYITVTAWNVCGNASLLAALQVSSPPLIIQPPTPQICRGLSITLSVPVSGLGYSWSPASTLNSSTADTVVATPSVTTTYTVTGTDSLGCLATDTITVAVNTPPNTPTITKTGDVLTSSATQSNQWLLNGTTITGATNKTYQFTTVGCYSVIATNLVNGCSSTSDTTCVSSISGIDQLSINPDQLSVYPNPTNGEVIVNISSSAGEVKDWKLQITDVLGRTVYTRQSLNYSNDIDLSNLPGGVYFITVINKTGRAVVPVVRQ
jgi:sugar lactone lactonase YvrE